MKRSLLILLLVWAVAASAQQKTKFAIASFGQDPFDQTATNSLFEKTDGSGARYAIIKVTSTNPEDDLRAYRFNFGQLNSLVEEHDGQLWVYVQRNAKLVTISREGFQTIDKHDLGLTIESGKTYIMQLSSAGTTVSYQTVMFNVSPASSNATIVIKSDKPGSKEEEFGTINASGLVGKNLELGTYTYRVVANNYQTTEGRITLKDRSNVHIEPITLRDVLYPMTITSKPSNSDLYINGERVGKTPYTESYPAGDYKLELKHVNNVPIMAKIHFEKDSTEYNYMLEKKYLKRYSGYVQGFVGFGKKHNTHCGIGLGAYIYNVNAELDISLYKPFKNNLKFVPLYYSYQRERVPNFAIILKMGYGFVVKKHLRITPQIGLSTMDFGFMLFSLTLGGRIEYVPVRNFGLFISPNWNCMLGNNSGYDRGLFNTWGTTPDLKMGMFVSF